VVHFPVFGPPLHTCDRLLVPPAVWPAPCSGHAFQPSMSLSVRVSFVATACASTYSSSAWRSAATRQVTMFEQLERGNLRPWIRNPSVARRKLSTAAAESPPPPMLRRGTPPMASPRCGPAAKRGPRRGPSARSTGRCPPRRSQSSNSVGRARAVCPIPRQPAGCSCPPCAAPRPHPEPGRHVIGEALCSLRESSSPSGQASILDPGHRAASPTSWPRATMKK